MPYKIFARQQSVWSVPQHRSCSLDTNCSSKHTVKVNKLYSDLFCISSIKINHLGPYNKLIIMNLFPFVSLACWLLTYIWPKKTTWMRRLTLLNQHCPPKMSKPKDMNPNTPITKKNYYTPCKPQHLWLTVFVTL